MSSICFCWSISYRDGPGQQAAGTAARRLFRAALPCLALMALIAEPQRRRKPSRRTCSARTRTSQVTLAGFAAAPDRRPRRTIRSTVRSCRRPDPSRQARAVARSDRSRTTVCRPRAAPPTSGYDSLNRKRKKPKYYPGQAKPKPPVGRRQPTPPPVRRTARPAACRFRRRNRRATRRRSPPAMAGTVVGQPPRKRLKIDDDPFGAVGDYAGSFLIKSAVEFSGGYDTNPGRLDVGAGQAVLCDRAGIPRGLRLGAPRAGRRSARLLHRLRQQSHAERRRHAAVGAARYRPAEFHRPCRRPARRQPRHQADRRRGGCWSRPTIPAARTCRRASPDIRSTPRSAAPSASTRISTGCRFPLGATVDRTDYTNSKLTDGTSTTNDDRNFTQYGGVGRVSYDLRPGREAVRGSAGRQPRA